MTSTCNPSTNTHDLYLNAHVLSNPYMNASDPYSNATIIGSFEVLVHTEYDNHTIVHGHTSEHRGWCLNAQHGLQSTLI